MFQVLPCFAMEGVVCYGGGGLVLDDCLVFTCGGWVLDEASFA